MLQEQSEEVESIPRDVMPSRNNGAHVALNNGRSLELSMTLSMSVSHSRPLLPSRITPHNTKSGQNSDLERGLQGSHPGREVPDASHAIHVEERIPNHGTGFLFATLTASGNNDNPSESKITGEAFPD